MLRCVGLCYIVLGYIALCCVKCIWVFAPVYNSFIGEPKREVERRRDLPYEEFYNTYALGQKPVIITDYAKIMMPTEFTLDYIKRVCGDKELHVKRRVEGVLLIVIS